MRPSERHAGGQRQRFGSPLGNPRTSAMRTALLNSYGGLTAALKRAVELQPAAEDSSFQVVIDGERSWQSQRLMEARFGSA